MLHICAEDQPIVMQTDPRLTDISWMPWPKIKELCICIYKGGNMNNHLRFRLLTWYDDPWVICGLLFHDNIGVAGGKRGT